VSDSTERRAVVSVVALASEGATLKREALLKSPTFSTASTHLGHSAVE
jgi:hypothetical protein